MITYKRRRLFPNAEEVNGYFLPIKVPFPEIFQAYDGPYSHFTYEKILKNLKIKYDDTFSLDVKSSPSTPVFASKTGVVAGLIDGINKFYTGLDFRTGLSVMPNLVLLRHPDSTLTLYSHLEAGSIRSGFCEKIHAGELIVRTGFSGWIGPTPHLHFEAFKKRGFDRVSFPVSFCDFKGELYHNNF